MSKKSPILRPAPPVEERPKCRYCSEALKPDYMELHRGAPTIEKCHACSGDGRKRLSGFVNRVQEPTAPCPACEGRGHRLWARYEDVGRVWDGTYKAYRGFYCGVEHAATHAVVLWTKLEAGESLVVSEKGKALAGSESARLEAVAARQAYQDEAGMLKAEGERALAAMKLKLETEYPILVQEKRDA